MKVVIEIDLTKFEFWGGAKAKVKNLTKADLEAVEEFLELTEWQPEGFPEYEINQLFWTDFDSVVQILGYEDEDDFLNKRGL